MIEISNNAIIIPTLEPNNNLIGLIKELQELKLNKIIIINDGSSSEYDYIFNKLLEMNCVVLKHEVNQGKGAALKKGIKYAYENMEVDGYVTADADCQHASIDILRISNELSKTNSFILGTRDFSNKNVPFKSYYGNKFSSLFFKLETGKKCNDTQTGLRGIPSSLTSLALNTSGDRYEYEMNFLMDLAKKNIEIKSINIQTIYENNNEVSHFRPFKDAVIIYKKPIKFLLSSLSSALIDLAIFTILILVLNAKYEIIIATFLSRIISGIYNYKINDKWSFKNNIGTNNLIKYSILFIVLLISSSILVYIFSFIPIFITLIKLIIDIILFIVSYVIQKNYIFKGSD